MQNQNEEVPYEEVPLDSEEGQMILKLFAEGYDFPDVDKIERINHVSMDAERRKASY